MGIYHGVPTKKLSPREKEVITLAVSGFTDKEIAVELGITYGTVRGYMNNICTKLAVMNRTHAAVIAVRVGIV